MPCFQLESVRHQATQVHKQLLDLRQRARSFNPPTPVHGPARSDFEVLLERKLARLARDIEHHIGMHGCS